MSIFNTHICFILFQHCQFEQDCQGLFRSGSASVRQSIRTLRKGVYRHRLGYNTRERGRYMAVCLTARALTKISYIIRCYTKRVKQGKINEITGL